MRVALEQKTDESCSLRFSIQDTGIGISPEKQGAVFGAFSQADGSTTRRFGGTGLGLSISSQLVTMMGGRIWLESEVGKGSTFLFTAGFGIDKTPVERVDTEETSSRLRDLKILIVDDNATNRRLLEVLLTQWQMSYISVGSGPAALQLLQEHSFNLVLLDVQMPSMDGFEVAAMIRQRWPESAIKIALLTSMGQRGDAAQCRDLNIGAYLCKPLKRSDLLEAIRRLVVTGSDRHVSGPRDLIARHSLREDKAQPSLSRHLRILVAEDNRVNQVLARRLLEKAGHTVTIAADGREAVQAFEQGLFDLILMDVQMPEMDGLRATETIRKRETGRGRTPIIALTAHAMSTDRDRCLSAGMDGFISKPIQLSELLSTLSAFCDESLEPVASPILGSSSGLVQTAESG